MIKIENVEIQGFEPAIRGMRNPKNSWDRSDSGYCGVLPHAEPSEERCMGCPMWTGTDDTTLEEGASIPFDMTLSPCGMMANKDMHDVWNGFVIGPNDHELAMKLSSGGPVHAKYRRQIIVWADITAPLYWWKEFDTYKVGTVANSCSTMHKIHANEFTLDDFSCEHLYGYYDLFDGEEQEFVPNLKLRVDENIRYTPKGLMEITVEMLNICRQKYLDICEKLKKDMDRDTWKKLQKIKKKIWWQMIQLLPSSYNQKRTVMFSYEMLANSDAWRADHKQDEWRDFCKWARTLPYSEFFTKKGIERFDFLQKKFQLPEEITNDGK